jgi:hypothetical protein
MVKKYFILLVFLSTILHSENIFEEKCVPCHQSLPTTLQKMFMNYLLVYGAEENVKIGLKYYLKNPSKYITVMSDLFVDNYGIKKKSRLSDKELDEALSIYWEKFKVLGKLK